MLDNACLVPLDRLLSDVAHVGRLPTQRCIDDLLDVYNESTSPVVRDVVTAWISASVGATGVDEAAAHRMCAEVVAAHATESAAIAILGQRRSRRPAGVWSVFRGRKP